MAARRSFRDTGPNGRKTLTLDNGGEFAEHEGYKEIGLNAYFCDPYCSWQKGGVENSNGSYSGILCMEVR